MHIEVPSVTGIKQAIAAIGTGKALAQRLGLSPMAVSGWVKRDKIPAERVLEIERITGVSRHELRPDLYPTEAPKQ